MTSPGQPAIGALSTYAPYNATPTGTWQPKPGRLRTCAMYKPNPVENNGRNVGSMVGSGSGRHQHAKQCGTFRACCKAHHPVLSPSAPSVCFNNTVFHIFPMRTPSRQASTHVRARSALKKRRWVKNKNLTSELTDYNNNDKTAGQAQQYPFPFTA